MRDVWYFSNVEQLMAFVPTGSLIANIYGVWLRVGLVGGLHSRYLVY